MSPTPTLPTLTTLPPARRVRGRLLLRRLATLLLVIGITTPVIAAVTADTAHAENDSIVINQVKLSDNQDANLRFLITSSYDRLAGDRADRLDTVAVAAWWALKEGVLWEDPADYRNYNNCAETGTDVHHTDDPYFVCARGYAWQVGPGAVQPYNYSLAAVEEVAAQSYGSADAALAATLTEAGYPAGSEVHQRIMAGHGDLRLGWLMRNPAIGVHYVAQDAQACFSDTSPSWCFVQGSTYPFIWDDLRFFAPDRATSEQVRAELREFAAALTEDGADPGTPPAASGLPSDVKATVWNLGGVSLNVRGQASTDSAVVATLTTGQSITIRCQVTGPEITNDVAGVSSTLWDFLPAQGGFVSDAWVYTGKAGQVARTCTDADLGGGAGDGLPRDVSATVWQLGGSHLNIRSTPSTDGQVVGSLAEGEQVVIKCQQRGTMVINDVMGVRSDLWDYVEGRGFVSDAWVLTGSDGQVAATCDDADEGTPPAPEPDPTPCEVAAYPGDPQTAIAQIESRHGIRMTDSDTYSWSDPRAASTLEAFWTTFEKVSCTPYLTTVLDKAGPGFSIIADANGPGIWGHWRTDGLLHIDIGQISRDQASEVTLAWFTAHELAHPWSNVRSTPAYRSYVSLYQQVGPISPYGVREQADADANENFADVVGYYVARCTPISMHSDEAEYPGNPYDLEKFSRYYAWVKENVFGGKEFGPGPGETCQASG